MHKLMNQSSLAWFFLAIGALGLAFGGTHQYISSIFCSIIASGITLLCTLFCTGRKDEYVHNIYEIWKLEKIFDTRAEANPTINKKFESRQIAILDIIALGLSSFRSTNRDNILDALNHGMHVRMLIMDPNGNFVAHRNKEEGNARGHLAKTIKDLETWVRQLNQDSTRGEIELKYYKCMTLDLYWRIDDEIYVGPYINGKQSQQTITYKFVNGGRGFQTYNYYFEEQWGNPKNQTVNVKKGST